MEMKQVLLDFLCGIDAKTGIVLYRWPLWTGTPKFMPTNVDIQFFYFRGYPSVPLTEDDFQNFNAVVKKINGLITLVLEEKQLSDNDLSRLEFNQLKCRKIATWLHRIHLKISASEGILPGIYGAKPGGVDEMLLRENHRKIKDIAADMIYEFHDQLWLARSVDEFLNIHNAAMARWVI